MKVPKNFISLDNANVIEGQATVMSEIIDQMPDRKSPDLVLFAVGVECHFWNGKIRKI